ncbi:MAG: MFS transporter [Eggerthellaceae bacterium]|nr:MFS transporter [Eggerthellaceae bacterium]
MDKSYLRIGRMRIHRAWIMLVACSCLGIGYLALIFGPNGVFFVAVCDDMGFARSDIAAWQQVHFIASALCMPVFGWLYERVSLRVVLSVSALGCVAASALMGTYDEAWQWMISGLLYGSLGAGLMYLPQAVVIGNWFDRRRGLALGISTAVAALATSVIAPLFAVLIDAMGWRSAYFAQAALIAAFTLPFTLFVIVRKPADVGALPYGYEPGGDAQERATATGSAGVPFRRALVSVPFVMLFLFAGIASLIGSGFDAHMAGYAVSIGFSPLFGSFLVSALYAGSFCEKLIMGWLNDRIGVQRTVMLELALVAAGMLGLVLLRNEVGLILASFVFGVQDSFISVSLPLLVRSFFGERDFARIFAWANVGSGLLGSFGSRLVGLSYDVTASFLPAFWVGIAACPVAVVLLLVARRGARRLTWEGLGEPR